MPKWRRRSLETNTYGAEFNDFIDHVWRGQEVGGKNGGKEEEQRVEDTDILTQREAH